MPCVLHVICQHLRQSFAIACFECGDHVFMIGDGHSPFFRAFIADVANASQSRLQNAMDLGERFIAGDFQDC
jgi:hypothetical protein